MAPKMIVLAGPPGSGKSTLYPVASFGVAYFNADDRAAELSGGSYIGISNEIRKTVNREFEGFILRSIEHRISFAIEPLFVATSLSSRRAWRNRLDLRSR